MPTEEPDLLFNRAEIQEITNREMRDEQADALAVLATSAVRDYCGWRIAKRKVEVLHLTPRRGSRLLFLPTLKLHDITAVTVGGVNVDPDDIDWDHTGVLEVHGRYAWPTRRRSIAVTIDHGHPATPGGIAQAIAASVARGALVPAGGIAAESAVGQSYTYSRTSSGLAAGAMFVRDELERLDPHRLQVSR